LLPSATTVLLPLAEEIAFQYEIVEGSHLGAEMCKGSFTKLSLKEAEARLENPVPILTNLKMLLPASENQPLSGVLYGKIVETVAGSSADFLIRFTSISPEAETFLRAMTTGKGTEETSVSETVSSASKLYKKSA
jgi:hypothetical protein